jgi:hypothetical protein
MTNERGKFKRIAMHNGWHIHEGLEAVDFVIQWATAEEKGEPTATYAVKVLPRNTAEDGDEVWIEIRGDGGEPGWLYGEADLLAFELGGRFTLVDREKLRKWIEENVEKDYVTLAHQALMKVYKKPDGSMRTLMKTYHLKALAEGEMRENG